MMNVDWNVRKWTTVTGKLDTYCFQRTNMYQIEQEKDPEIYEIMIHILHDRVCRDEVHRTKTVVSAHTTNHETYLQIVEAISGKGQPYFTSTYDHQPVDPEKAKYMFQKDEEEAAHYQFIQDSLLRSDPYENLSDARENVINTLQILTKADPGVQKVIDSFRAINLTRIKY